MGRNDHHVAPGRTRGLPLRPNVDNYPKYLSAGDVIQQRDGIIHASIPEFMQRKEGILGGQCLPFDTRLYEADFEWALAAHLCMSLPSFSLRVPWW